MKITFFQFFIHPDQKEILERLIKDRFFEERDLKKALTHLTLNFTIEHASRLALDHITEGQAVYSHQSYRYVTFNRKNLQYYTPPQIEENKKAKEIYDNIITDLFDTYCEFTENGIPAEDARSVFPGAFDSNIKIGLQGGQILDFIVENLTSRYEENREIAQVLAQMISKEIPNTVKNIYKIAEDFELERRRERLDAVKNSLLNSVKTEVHFVTKDPEMEAALGASICYRKGAPSEYIDNFPKSKQLELLRKIVSIGHASVTEHGFIQVKSSLSRGVVQQLRRHRIIFRTQQFIEDAADNKADFVTPPTLMENSLLNDKYKISVKKAMDAYESFKKMGISKYDAAYIVPNGIRINFCFTTNAREIEHILGKRLCQRAQWEFRDLAYQIAEKLIERFPVLFSNLGPGCFKGRCPEKEMCCKNPHIYKQFREAIEKKSKVA
jgi:thymidylate synthase (FAD)